MHARSQELLDAIGARFCALETLVELTPTGDLKLESAAQDLFADFGQIGAPASTTRAATPRYLLPKDACGGWKLVLGGKPTNLPPWKGVDYIAHLPVKATGELIHGKDLGARAGSHVVIEGQGDLPAGDAESLKGTLTAQQKCHRALDDPDSSEAERSKAEANLAEIEAWVWKRMRGTKAGKQKQVCAIRQSIRRVLENLEKSKDGVWRAFAQHLDKHLWKPSGRSLGGRNVRVRAGLAGRFTYEPPNGVKWSSRPLGSPGARPPHIRGRLMVGSSKLREQNRRGGVPLQKQPGRVRCGCEVRGAVLGAFLRRLSNPALCGVAFADLRNPVTFNSRL